MPQITIDLSAELARCRLQHENPDPENPESPFLQSNYTLQTAYAGKMQDVLQHLHEQTQIPLQDLQLSPAVYAITNFNFFIEHFKNAYDAGATHFQITVDVDEAAHDIVCTVKDDGRGFTSMFTVPAEPVKPTEEAPSSDSEAYAKAKERYDRQVARVASKDPSGFADYRSILDPGFSLENGFSPSRMISDKGVHGADYETTKGTTIMGGRGLGLATTATLLNNTTGMQGSIHIGDARNLAASGPRQTRSGAAIDDNTGAVTVFRSPIFTPDMLEATRRYLEQNPTRSSPHEKDYLRFVEARVGVREEVVEEVAEEVEDVPEFSFGRGSGSAPSTPRAATGAGVFSPDSSSETLLSPSSPRSPQASPKSAQSEASPVSPSSPGRYSMFDSSGKAKKPDAETPAPDQEDPSSKP
jgi:hypothetical protein